MKQTLWLWKRRAESSSHTELHCAERDAIEIVPRLCEIYDEPFSDECGIPTYLLCKAARDEVKVALSADGGDEFFCGYTHYTMLSSAWERVSSLPLALRRAGSTVLRQVGVGAVKAMEPLLVKKTNRLYPDLEAADFSDKLLKLSHVLSAPGIRAAYTSSISVWPRESLKDLAPGLKPYNALAVLTRNESDDPSLENTRWVCRAATNTMAERPSICSEKYCTNISLRSLWIGQSMGSPFL